MRRVEVRHHFAAPPKAVWDVYTDHARWSEWGGFQKSWLEVEGSHDRNGTGAVRCLGTGPFVAVEEVLDFEPPKRMTYRFVRGPMPFENHLGEALFEPENGGTRLVWRCHFDSKIPGLGWLLERFVTQVFRRSLRGLERHCFPAPRL